MEVRDIPPAGYAKAVEDLYSLCGGFVATIRLWIIRLIIMNDTEIRQQAKEYIEQLSPEKLLVAVDFLAYLAEHETNEATEELLQIPGFSEAFAKAQKNIAAGKVTSVDQLKRKY